MKELDRSLYEQSVLLSTLLDLKGIDTCYRAGSLAAVKDFLSQNPNSFLTWPSLDLLEEHGYLDYPYGTTLNIQRFYRQHQKIPVVSVKTQLQKWALDFIEEYVAPHRAVVVHLKNNPRKPNGSNAKFDEWLAFFEASVDLHDVKFILIGNEEVDPRIRRLPNVLVTKNIGNSLAQDLALIQTSFAFLGMASGPCNMAIFSNVPYVIYKHPNHHAEEMELELGKGERFPFATPRQKFKRVFETCEDLKSEFAFLYSEQKMGKAK